LSGYSKVPAFFCPHGIWIADFSTNIPDLTQLIINLSVKVGIFCFPQRLCGTDVLHQYK